MKLRLLLLLFILPALSHSQSSADKLDVVSWNLEWYGASFESPADDNLQERNALVVLRALNADIYGLVEIVDTMRLRRLTDSLGMQFDFVVSPFSSNNSTGTGNSWLNGQKLAFIYNTNIFTNVTSRGLMRNSGPAYTNWASGRFPFMLSADVSINNITRRMNFILIHGKAGSAESDYNRRRDGAQELKDTLDAHYSSALNFIIGDFNDALNTTICTSCQSQASSFDVIVRDSTDNDHYRSITLPLGAAGESSMTSFPNVVDNHVISNEVYPFYVQGSAKIRKDIASAIPNYAITTSDHYPVYSQYLLTGISTGIVPVDPSFLKISFSPNPFTGHFYILAKQSLKNVFIRVTDATGRIIIQERISFLQADDKKMYTTAQWKTGIYYVQVLTGRYHTGIKLVRQ